jgi:hypothetical protein
MYRPQAPLGEGGAEAREVGASGLSQQQTPTTDVAIKRAAVRNQPIRLATMTNASSSAAGSAISPINVHLTNDIDPIPASALGISLVGATVGIVYGSGDATICAGCSARASGSVRSRAYILAWEPISASADFPLPAPTDPAVPSRRPRACDVFDIYTIIFLALAVFIFLRLRSVLGQRTGRERPPYDPYAPRDAVRGATNDNVVTLPSRAAEAAQKPVESAEPAERWKGIAEVGRRWPPVSTPSPSEDKTFDASISSPGRGRRTK